MHRKMGRGALVLGQGGKKVSILIIRYHNSRRSLSHSRYIAEIKRLVQVVISYYGITEKSGT